MGSEILTVDELHQYLKIPRPTIYTLAQQGRIPAAKIGKHWRFEKSTINRWLRKQQRARASETTARPSTRQSSAVPLQTVGATHDAP